MSDVLVRIDFACNDPDSGSPVGRVCQIALPDGLLELTARNWNILSFNGCPRFRDNGRAIFLSGRRWPYERSKTWFGNWCWDAYWFRDQIARQFLVWLHSRELFTCDGGEVRLSNSWDSGDPLDLEPDRASPTGLGRLLVKAMLAEPRMAAPPSGSDNREKVAG